MHSASTTAERIVRKEILRHGAMQMKRDLDSHRDKIGKECKDSGKRSTNLHFLIFEDGCCKAKSFRGISCLLINRGWEVV